MVDELISRRAAIEAIEKLQSAQPACKWIKPEERLPEKPGVYLVTLNHTGVDFCEWYESRYFGWLCKPCYEVTAWMPLPEPCKEEY